MWLSRYICLFFIYSFMGWIYETLYCTIKNGKWENRGFLFGPACPIYGTGAVAISVIMKVTIGNGIVLSLWQIFLIAFIGSAGLEYITSWGLEKLFHAAWWDYSDFPLNLHGRISLFTSLGFCRTYHSYPDRTFVSVLCFCVCGRFYAYSDGSLSF